MAMSCGVQCVAVCCSVLHCAALCCSVLRCVAECCRVLQSVAWRRERAKRQEERAQELQHTATHS